MSTNATPIVTRVSTVDGAPDPYDHEISLIDATASSELEDPRSASPSPSWRRLARKPTKSSVKDHLARRKYAKWQEHRQSSKPSSIATDEDQSLKAASGPDRTTDPAQKIPKTQTLDFARGHDTSRGRTSVDKRRVHNNDNNSIYEIDVLYENQRGSFFCGIPLYSNSSLMPIDPAPWLNKDFRESAVNITNAQLPDPSWAWAWKSWYVDMSYDVDEEGWQYSFAFARTFAWHGTHPWFHSFVRRRRWLRKRIKQVREPGTANSESMGAAHHLTGDYFTIHSKRNRSPVSAVDGPGKTARPASYISYPDTLDVDEPPEDVNDIPSLLKSLRIATIDREKIDVVKKFIDSAGDELAYLKDHIAEIMSFFVFQNSRRQLLTYLKESANAAQEHRENHTKAEKPESEAESRRINSLLSAVDAANAQISGLEYWSDRKDVLKTVDNESDITRAIATIFDEPAPEPKPDLEPVKEIRGISDNAEITEEKPSSHAVSQTVPQVSGENRAHEKVDKGKGRAHENEHDQVEESSPVRLQSDQVLVPDDD